MPVLAKFVSITRTKLAHRGITVSRESIRYGPSSLALYTLVDCSENTEFTAIPYTLMNYSPVCRIIQVNGKQHYLWRAVDQDGEVVDVFLQAKRDGAAGKRFFKRLLRSHGSEPRKIVTDKLRSYCVAHRELIPEAIHSTNSMRIIGQSNPMRRPG